MRNNCIVNLTRSAVIIVVILLAGSCLEYTVNTKVNRDGSIIREYTVKGDSSEIFEGSLMIPSGNQWRITGGFDKEDKQKDEKDKQYVYTASRRFNTVAEFQEWLASDTASGTIKIKVNLKKRFRWFYTYYEYTEMYPMSFAFRKIPVDSFLTEIEQSVLMEDARTIYSPIEKKWIWKKDTLNFQYNHADSVEIKRINDTYEKKMEVWMTAAVVREFTDIVKSNFGNDSSISGLTEKFSRHLEIIRDKAFSSNDSLLTKMLILMGDSLMQNKRLSDLYARNPLVFCDFEKKIKTMDERDYSDNYEYYLSMPGQVFTTNAFKRDRIRMNWKFGPMQFFMKDFEMKAESRVANLWSMIFTAIFAAGLLFIILRKRR